MSCDITPLEVLSELMQEAFSFWVTLHFAKAEIPPKKKSFPRLTVASCKNSSVGALAMSDSCVPDYHSLTAFSSISAFLFLSEVHHQYSLMGRRADRLSGILGNSQGPLAGDEEKSGKFQNGHKEKERQCKLNKHAARDTEGE